MAEPGTRRWSLRGRLLAAAGVSCALAWLAGGVATWYATQREDSLLFDARLADLSQTLILFADHELRELRMEGGKTPLHIDTEASAQGRYRYQIWSSDGRLMLSSAHAPLDRPLMPLAERGWATRRIGSETFRVLSMTGPGGLHVIQAAEPVSERLQWTDLVNGTLVGGLLLSALALGGVTVWLVRGAVGPLRRAEAQLQLRGPSDLRAVDASGLPAELAPMLNATNQVMERVDVALRSEREFVAAAAHELRTPLAGLRAQAELAAHARSSPAMREEALRAVLEGADHCAHLVGQLLDLARSDVLAGNPVGPQVSRCAVDLGTLVERAMVDLAPAAARRSLRLIQRLDAPVVVGAEFGLGLAVRNLLDNAIAHARDGGEVLVTSRAEDGRIVFAVDDDGPGIPAAERAHVFERFYRGKGNTRPGCGLGLSIVKTIADAHGATITLGESPLGGLRVALSFPGASSDRR